MKPFVPPPHPPEWIDTDEELPEGPVDMRMFFSIDDMPPVPRGPTGEDKEATWNEEAEALFNQVAEEWWKHGPGGK